MPVAVYPRIPSRLLANMSDVLSYMNFFIFEITLLLAFQAVREELV